MASQQILRHSTEQRNRNNSGISRTSHWYRKLRLALSCLLIMLAYSQVVPAAHAAPGITVTPTSGLQTSETGGIAHFTVVLNQRPTANVTIGLSSSDTTEGTVSPTSLTFTPANWSVPQIVTVTGVDDNLDDNAIAYTIVTAPAVSADPGYNDLNAADVSVTNSDNDTAGLIVSQISRHTTELTGQANRQATFTVRLSSQPTGNVIVAVASSDTSEATVSPTSLTFTTANWATPQTVTVTGATDTSNDGHVAYNVTLTPSGGGYTAGLAKTVQLYTLDDDLSARVNISNPSNLTVTEAVGAGRTATFTVVLNSNFGTGGGAANRTLTLSFSSSKASRATVSPASITFANSAGNGRVAWNSTQTVTITGVDNSIDDGDEPLFINITATTAGTGNPYDNNTSHRVPPIPFTVIDNDTAGFTVSTPANTTTTEAGNGSPRTFTIALNSQPTANVSIPLSSSDPTEGTVSPSTLTFTTANWNTPQTVTVTGVNDDVDDGDIAYTIVTGPASSSDTVYNLLNPADRTFTNIDDDTAGLSISPISGNTTEAGGTATFTVKLNSQPIDDVVVDLSSSDTTEGTVSPSSLTFTPANWNTAQTVTVTGVDDAQVDGDIDYTITVDPSNSYDVLYAALSANTVNVTNIDDDSIGIVVSPTSGLVTTEAGGTATFDVVLNGPLTADVIITLSSSDTTEGTVSPSSLTFTPGNWNTPQTVTITGVDDDVDDGDIAYAISFNITSSDPEYSTISLSDLNVTNIDDDTAGVTIAPNSGLQTTEAGDTATFDVVLTSEPTDDVTIDLSSSDTTEGTVSPSSLTFTPANWNTPQTVTITGVDDAIDDDDVDYQITLTVSSADSIYDALAPSVANVTNIDDDTAGVTITPNSGLVTSEAGDTATFDVVLTSEPTDDVTINLSSSNTNEGTVDPASLVFTPANWNVAQTVTVTGVDDAIDDDDIAYTINSTVSSNDAKYNNLSIDAVEVTNIDNDGPGFTITPLNGLTTTEAGGTATFTVVLNMQPTDDVTIDLSSSDTTEGTVSPSSLTFTPANWNIPQTVTITGVDDNVDDDDVSYTIEIAAAQSNDPAYDGLDPADVSVTNIDDDTAGVTVSAISGSTSEKGGTATFTVKLNSQPTANVTINLSSSDTTEGTVSPSSLTFTPANWNIPQTVTVTGVKDDIADGNVTYTIITSAAISADPKYNGMAVPDVTVINIDDPSSVKDTNWQVFLPFIRR